MAVILVAIHLMLSADRRRELSRIALAVAMGVLVEGLHITVGTYRFTSGTVVALLPPPWLLVMWAQMATTFDYSMRPVVARPAAAAVFGAVGGPLAFLAGERLGAITLYRPLAPGLALLAISWAIAMMALAFAEQWAARRTHGFVQQDAPRGA